MRSRPTSVTVAAVLLALLSVLRLISTLIPEFSEGVPAIVVYGGAVLGVAGLIAAYGLLGLKKWGVWLTIVLSVLNGLSAAPGIPFAPTDALRIVATVTVLVSALSVVRVVLPVSRRAFAAP